VELNGVKAQACWGIHGSPAWGKPPSLPPMVELIGEKTVGGASE